MLAHPNGSDNSINNQQAMNMSLYNLTNQINPEVTIMGTFNTIIMTLKFVTVALVAIGLVAAVIEYAGQ